jgi:HEAT repeat-containing protein 5
MASNQHLKNNIAILKALAEDLNAPVVQAWALHALYLIADSGGPMFRGYVDQTLGLCMKLLLSVPRHHNEVFHCIGKCLSALITAVGPELNGANEAINVVRSTCLSACVMMHAASADWISHSEAVQSFQQVHMFAPKHVNFTQLVPDLVRHLSSPHLLLRQSAIDCLRQLCQRETGQVCNIAKHTQVGHSSRANCHLRRKWSLITKISHKATQKMEASDDLYQFKKKKFFFKK